ncbi:Arm DNA-binding domain-containing protein [Methylophaga sp.]|uniref:Arm DNA-binding domain-containing protein n=1 Tax=Methylophaga sp. TaxID=2024840 RepID=UPI003A92C945
MKLKPTSLKLPKGVEAHGNRLRISFQIEGKRFREPLTEVAKINKSSIQYAESKRNAILTEIKEKRFDYALHFPHSKNAKLFSGWGGPELNKLVPDVVDEWLSLQERKRATSTYKNYKSKAKHVKRKWAKRRIADITKSEIELFQMELLETGLKAKTVNDIFTVVRQCWESAFHDGIVRINPLERIPNIQHDGDYEFADPFTLNEMKRIMSVKTMRQQDINMIMFACWCGLSVSELIALSWDDVDTENWTIHVKRAKVENEFKVPKEHSRTRRVDLIEPAKHWLQRQQVSTFLLPAEIVQVTQRDNVTVKDETVRFVFRNGQSNQVWSYNSLCRWFTGHLKRAKVRHRGPNQCRHTFASRMLSCYMELEWIARQLGHSDTTMIKRHYGRWIISDTPNMAGEASRRLGYEVDSGGQGKSDSAPILPQK